MVLAALVYSDATGGGVGAAPTNCPSLTVPGDAGADSHLVGHTLDGVSVNECTITVPGDRRWESTGFSLRPTSDGTAIGRGKPVDWWDNPVPVKAGQTITPTITSGANYAWGILYFDVAPFNYQKPALDALKAPVYKWTRATAASGTNLTANTWQTGLVTHTQFGEHDYEIDDIVTSAAFTTNPIISLKSETRGSTPYDLFFMLPLTDVANDWDKLRIPKGQIAIKQGTTLKIGWLGETAEQPTANITYKYAAGK